MTIDELKTKFTDLKQVLSAARMSIDIAWQTIDEEIEPEVFRLSRRGRAEERVLIKAELKEVTRLIDNVVREL